MTLQRDIIQIGDQQQYKIVQNFFTMAPSSNQQLQKLRNIHIKLSEMSLQGIEKIQTQKSIYQELIKIFSKFSTKVSDLSKRINDEILTPSLSKLSIKQEIVEDDSVLVHYQFLSNSLSKLADCAKKISTIQKQQVSQPIKILSANYKSVNEQLLGKIVENITKISEYQFQMNKNKESYYSLSQKFQKQREMQDKVISKIENGDKSQLEKFNVQIKKLSDSILTSQNAYKESISKINDQWQTTKKSIDQTIIAYSNNQETRVSFSKRFVLSTLKLFEDLEKGIVKDADVKLKQAEVRDKQKRSHLVQARIFQQIKQIKSVTDLVTFVSHEDYRKKMKRNQNVQSEHLQQIFKKVRPEDKEKIKDFIGSWFNTFENDDESDTMDGQESLSMTSQSSGNNRSSQIKQQSPNEKLSKSRKSHKSSDKQQQKLDSIKGKIIQILPYSYYFIEELYNQIMNMSSFYCKLNDENFYYLLSTFNVVTKTIDMDFNNDIAPEFLYKMMQISQRVSWKRNNLNQNKPIELLSAHYANNKKFFNNKKTISLLYNFLVKKKTTNKKSLENSKNPLSTLTKNIFSRKRDKQVTLSSDDQFNCISQITNMMASFNIDQQISLTFIKDSIPQSVPNKMTTFEYLKGIILSKKDIEERRKIFFKTEVKEKRQKQIKKLIETKKIAEFCIQLTAKRGYFSKDQICLRLVSKFLKNVHWQVLAHLQIETPQKWVHLIPYDKKMQYIEMKQQVAQKSVPSATEQIITLDVNRSLHIHGETLTPTVLHTLLRVYAFYHRDISYCQGMNYIAGYIYLKTLNEQSAYRVFEYLMEIRFKQLFANEFQVLKIKMYQFDRLLAIFHPQISEHFKKQGISPQCYIVSWIITLFASSYQYTMQSYLIDTLWERFIIYGWKEFFRFILWMFDLKKEQLIELTYDRALHSLGQIARSKFLLASYKDYKEEFKHIQKVQDGMNRFEVTQQLLDSLVSEYKLSK